LNELEYEIHVALYQRLRTDPDLAAAAQVYDAIPNGAAFPYVSIDDYTGERYYSKTFEGLEFTATLSAVSESSGKAEVLRLMSLVRRALLDPLELRGGHVVDYQTVQPGRVLEFNDTDVVVTPIKQGVITFTIRAKEAA